VECIYSNDFRFGSRLAVLIYDQKNLECTINTSFYIFRLCILAHCTNARQQMPEEDINSYFQTGLLGETAGTSSYNLVNDYSARPKILEPNKYA